jgi:hypothetical protein
MDFSHLGLTDISLLVDIVPTGSRFNCDPPVMNTDQDYLVYCTSNFDDVLVAAGYQRASLDLSTAPLQAMVQQHSVPKKGGKPDETFVSWRRGDINLIVTQSRKFFLKHKVAGFVCKNLNLLSKDDRIMVYHAIMYGEFNGNIDQFKTPSTKGEIDFFALNKVFST